MRARLYLDEDIVISYRQYSRRDLGDLIRAAAALLDTVAAEDLAGALHVLDPFRQD